MISGRVQGVSFRLEAAQKARELKVTGWVRNLRDGRVELWVEGPDSPVEALLEWCRHGPPLARVEGVEIQSPEETASTGHDAPQRFEIRPTA